MLSEDEIVEELRRLGLYEGAHVLAHVSVQAVGPVSGGAGTVLSAFQRVLGPSGTLLVPTFTPEFFDPADREAPPETIEELERERAASGTYDMDATPTADAAVGAFSEIVRQQPGAKRSDHPVLSYAAVGALADPLTKDAPFHYPLGSESPVARLHRLKGWCVLIGVGHEENSALPLAEVWADVPYIHRRARVTSAGNWLEMQGAPGCTDGFGRIELILRQARIARVGMVGAAKAQLMRLQEAVSLAVAMLQGSGDALLCDDPNCPKCRVGRKFTADSTHIEGQAL